MKHSSEAGFFSILESIIDIGNIADMHETKKDVGDFKLGEELEESVRIIRITKGSMLIASYCSLGSAIIYVLLDKEV